MIALTHMMYNRDEDMAAKSKASKYLDMILGGHDHNYIRSLN